MGIKALENKLWLSSPTMYGEERMYVKEAFDTNWVSTVGENINQFEKNICPGCAHCGICIKACPVQAIYKDPKTGFVLTDKEKCIGCHACEKVCPKDVIHFDKDGKMEKCDGCIERIREGREPACVRVCFPGAITLE